LDQGQKSESTRRNSGYGGSLLNQMRYLLSILAIIAGTIIAAKTAEPAVDANGNTAKILISNIDDFTIEDD